MKFSIVIPVYNVEKYIHQCIESVLEQNFSDYEIILINDGSSDNCGKICDEYGQQHSHIIVIHKSNGGLSDARNFGIKKAQGEYLIFLDSDDYWQGENILSSLQEIIDNENPDIIIHSFTYDNLYTIKKDHSTFKTFMKQINSIKNQKNNISDYKTELLIKGIYESTGWNKIIKKEIIDKYNLKFPFGKLHEDIFWSFDILKVFEKISFFKSNFYQYRINREGSITKEIKPKNIINISDFILKESNLVTNDFMEIYLLQIYFALNHKLNFLSKENRTVLKPIIENCHNVTKNILKKHYPQFGLKGYLIKILGVRLAFWLNFKFKNLFKKIKEKYDG